MHKDHAAQGEEKDDKSYKWGYHILSFIKRPDGRFDAVSERRTVSATPVRSVVDTNEGIISVNGFE
jgi:hypothetical protein